MNQEEEIEKPCDSLWIGDKHCKNGAVFKDNQIILDAHGSYYYYSYLVKCIDKSKSNTTYTWLTPGTCDTCDLERHAIKRKVYKKDSGKLVCRGLNDIWYTIVESWKVHCVGCDEFVCQSYEEPDHKDAKGEALCNECFDSLD